MLENNELELYKTKLKNIKELCETLNNIISEPDENESAEDQRYNKLIKDMLETIVYLID